MQPEETGKPDEVEQIETAKMTEEEAADYVKRSQYGQTGSRIDQTMGGMGGAGAAGSGPDIARQSAGMPGNHSDLPSGSR